ncbi:MAG: Pr6Pr family membrane protein [Pyrinomonadaceae bacterium]
MARIFAGVIAIVGWFALVLQFVIVLTSPANQPLSVPERIIRYFSFFTILTNLIVAFTTAAIAFFPGSRVGSLLSKPTSQAAVGTYISIVGLVYSLFLRAVWDPQGWQAVADHLLHDAVPLAFVVYWIAFAPKAGIGWGDALKWLAYPLAYVAYSLTRGALVDWYPYWFVDVTQLGYSTALTNAGLVLIAFLIVGFAFVTFAKLMTPSPDRSALDRG